MLGLLNLYLMKMKSQGSGLCSYLILPRYIRHRNASNRNPSSDMLRLLGVVQRQRSEHRKIQRLILDTSGHGQSEYARQRYGGEQDLPPLQVRNESCS